MTSPANFTLGFTRQLVLKSRLLSRIYEDWCKEQGVPPEHEPGHGTLREALLARLLDSLCTTSQRIRKMGEDGILISPSSSAEHQCDEWNAVKKPPLIYARLALSLTDASSVQVDLGEFTDLSHHLTPFDQLSDIVEPGSPIQLLPWNTSAFYLTDYKGVAWKPEAPAHFHILTSHIGTCDSSRTLTSQFQASLPRNCHFNPQEYILACIVLSDGPTSHNMPNRTVTLIYPRSLAVLVTHPSRHALKSNEIPHLPNQLQASPVASFPLPKGTGRLPQEYEVLDSRTLPLRHSMSITTSALDATAKQVSTYVQFVVKERERLRTSSAYSPSRSTFTPNPQTMPIASMAADKTDRFIVAPTSFYPSPETSPPQTHPTPGPSSPVEYSPSVPPNHHFPSHQQHQENPFLADEWTSMGIDLDFLGHGHLQAPFNGSTSPAGFPPEAASALYTRGGPPSSSLTHNPTSPSPYPQQPSHARPPPDDLMLTDDDFSFFDAPPSASGSSFPIASSNVFPHTGFAVDEMMAGILSSSAPPGILPDSAMGIDWEFTLEAVPAEAGPFENDPSAAMRSLPTPGTGMTPFSPTVGALSPTPNVLQIQPYSPSSTSSHPLSGGLFDIVRFGKDHEARDSKYSDGKFRGQMSFGVNMGLPSPPPDTPAPPSHGPISVRSARSSVGRRVERRTIGSWKMAYDAKTNPSIGVVRRLAKRRIQLNRSKSAPARQIEDDDEEWRYVRHEREQEASSSSSSDIEDAASVPSSPISSLPAYLPPGPSLASTKFKYDSVLASLAPQYIPPSTAPTPIGMPTPISPPRVSYRDTAKEKQLKKERKELEKWAMLVAREVVSSPETFCERSESGQGAHLVVDVDVRWIKGVFDTTLRSLEELDKEDTGICSSLLILVSIPSNIWPDSLEGPTFSPLQPPAILLTRQSSLLAMSPASLRFWDKLGLGPRWGRKDVSVCIAWLEQDYVGDRGQFNSPELSNEGMKEWLDALVVEWQRSGLGEIHLSQHQSQSSGIWRGDIDGLSMSSIPLLYCPNLYQNLW